MLYIKIIVYSGEFHVFNASFTTHLVFVSFWSSVICSRSPSERNGSFSIWIPDGTYTFTEEWEMIHSLTVSSCRTRWEIEVSKILMVSLGLKKRGRFQFKQTLEISGPNSERQPTKLANHSARTKRVILNTATKLMFACTKSLYQK